MTGISDVVRQVHLAGQQPREWQAIVAAIAALVPNCGVMLISCSNAADERPNLLHAGYPAGAVEYAADKFAARLSGNSIDSAGRGIAQLNAAPEIARDEHAASPPLIREWGTRYGFSTCFRVLVWDDAQRAATLRIDQRTGTDDDATAALRSVLTELAGHLRIAFAMTARITRMACASTLTLFDRLAIPALSVDLRGNLIAIGELARLRLMATGVLLVDGAGVVRLANGRENDEFHALLASSGAGNSRRHMMHFSVPHQPGPNVLECFHAHASQPAPASNTAIWAGNVEPYILVQFRCRTAVMTLPTVADALVLGLSKTEAMTAIGLVEGLTAEEQAAARGVAAETARWHAKNIYERLDCDRAEMARLMMGLLEPRLGLPVDGDS